MFFFLILVTTISGMPTPEICFLPGQFRLTNLPRSTTASHSVSVNWTHNFPTERQTLCYWTIGAPAKSSSPMPGCPEMIWCAVGALLHWRNLVGDTGDVSPHFFRRGRQNMPCPPTFFLFRFCIWRGFKNKNEVCRVFGEELFMSHGRPYIAKLILKQSLVWYHWFC